MNLTNLPDEVLVLIFDLLEGEDKLMLNRSCRRFNEILKEKRLSRKLDLNSSYSVSLSNLKLFFKPKIKQQNIREFNITSCYWITSSEIRTLVSKMVNLEALYAADTVLVKEHLVMLLQSLPQLKRLSFTWKRAEIPSFDKMIPEIISAHLKALEFISFYLKSEDFTEIETVFILNWLHFCTALKELRIIARRESELNWAPSYLRRDLIRPISFPKMHTMVLSVPGCSYATGQVGVLYHLLMEVAQDLKNLWITTPAIDLQSPVWPHTISDAKTLVTTSLNTRFLNEKPWKNIFSSSTEKLPNMEHFVVNSEDMSTDLPALELPTLELPKLKKLLWSTFKPTDWNALWNFCASLEELNIGSCLKDIKQVYFQDSLTKLALRTCILKGDVCQPSSGAEQSNRVIRILVKSFPNITEFEFTHCPKCIFKPNDIAQEPGLALFGEWRDLHRLKLEGLECIRTGKPFSHVFGMCENLESISLKNLGQHGSCTYLFELCKGLENCKNLKDFRLEQANVLSMERLLATLRKCNKLERICIISVGYTKIPEFKNVVKMVRNLERLVFLYINITNWTQISRKRLAKILNKEFKSSRPSLHASFLCDSVNNEDHLAVPGIHYFEMLKDVSRISTRRAVMCGDYRQIQVNNERLTIHSWPPTIDDSD